MSDCSLLTTLKKCKRKMTDSAHSIPVLPAPACPICGSEGPVVLRDCHDYICRLPGIWQFRECNRCRSLWLDPRPTDASIPALYPENYRFTRSDSVSQIGNVATVVGGVKLAIVENTYGYSRLKETANSKLGVNLGNVLSGVRLARDKAGHAVRFLHCRHDAHLLDVGCGNGAFLSLMRSLGWTVRGIEPDASAAAYARGRGLEVEVNSLEQASLPPATYDAITMTHVAEHFPLPARTCELLAPALKPGGVLVSISPNPWSLLRRMFRNHWYDLDPPRHFALPSPQGYRMILEPLGFEVETWTTMRMGYWSLKESLSIARTRDVGQRTPRPLLHLLNLGLKTAGIVMPMSGEEVVCYATKR